jgi:hypothetical protein
VEDFDVSFENFRGLEAFVAEAADVFEISMELLKVFLDVFDISAAEGTIEQVFWLLIVNFRQFFSFVLFGVSSTVSL